MSTQGGDATIQRLASDNSSSTPHEKILPILPSHVRFLSRLKWGCKRLMHYWWAWEFLAASLSIIATIVLIIVLAIYNGRPLRPLSFGASQLSLNALLAAISTVIRTSLLLTVAGPLNQSAWNWFSPAENREPAGKPIKDLDTFADAAFDSWSSIKLLSRTRGRHLASLGASIIVLSLAFDVFAQQVLSTQRRGIANDKSRLTARSGAHLPRTLAYEGVWSTQISGSSISSGAVLSSVFDKDPALPGASCPTGNCTWPITPSLGICSSCSDARERMTKTGNESSLTYSLSWSQNDTSNIDTTLELVSIDGDTTSAVAKQSSSDAVLPLNGSSRLIVSRFNMLAIPPTKYNYYVANYGSGEKLNSSNIDSLVVAHSCEFYFCLQAFSAATTAGQMRQKMVSIWDQWTPPANRSDLSASWSLIDVPSTMNVDDPSKYRVDNLSMLQLAIPMQKFTIGKIDALASGARFGRKSRIFDAFATDDPAGPYIGGFMFTYWNASNSTETMGELAKQMADSLTNWMRTNIPADIDSKYAPTVFSEETFVRVRWAWLVFPLGLVLVGQIFLLATIWQTRQRQVRPWKSHRIPLLLACVDDDIKRLARGGMDSRTGLEERVGGIEVRLEYDDRDKVSFKKVKRNIKPSAAAGAYSS